MLFCLFLFFLNQGKIPSSLERDNVWTQTSATETMSKATAVMYKFCGRAVRERFCSVSMFDLHVSCTVVIIVHFILSAWQANNVSVASPVRWYCHFLQSAINWITGTRAFGSVNSLSVSSLIHPFPQLYFPHLRLCSLTWFSVECLSYYILFHCFLLHWETYCQRNVPVLWKSHYTFAARRRHWPITQSIDRYDIALACHGVHWQGLF